jgi:hypothetical protein
MSQFSGVMAELGTKIFKCQFINFQNDFYSIFTLFLIQDPSILQLYQNKHRESVKVKGKGKGKGRAIPVTGRGGP